MEALKVKNTGKENTHEMVPLSTFWFSSFIKKMDSKTVLFVGAESGFFFIGTKDEFFKVHDRIERGLKIAWEKRVQNTKSKNYFSKPKPTIHDHYVSLYERTIFSAYKRFTGDGIIVILEGEDKGPYWERSEFLEAYGELLEPLQTKKCANGYSQ